MITDQDVAELYRCLLGRAPETPDTVAAFKSYYPDFARGRRAILQSEEFSRIAAAAQGDAAARLAQAFLRRAGGHADIAATAGAQAMRGAMLLVLRAHGDMRLAVIAGAPDLPLADIVPVAAGRAAVLHIAPRAPVRAPQLAPLPSGATVFRIDLDPVRLAEFLAEADLAIDLLAVFGRRPGFFAALQSRMSEHAVLLSDTPLPPQTDAWPHAERSLRAAGLHLRFLGGWFLPVTYAPPPRVDPGGTIPGLCVVAIMRNEEAAAPNMIASLAAVAGHFVIVDTGSTDATMARAEACLRASGTPYTLQSGAAGRFDDMRNAALDLVPDTAAWVLMLDADEELCPEDHQSLRALLEAAEYDAYALPRYNYTGLDKSGEVMPYPDRQVRLFRNRPGERLRYSGAVHETIRGVPVCRLPLDASAIGLDRGGPHIHHLVRRFRSPQAEAAKQAHYRELAAEESASF
jgi:hypothetical protein